MNSSDKCKTSLTASLLKNAIEPTVDVSEKICSIEKLMTMSRDYRDVYDVIRKTVEMLLDDIQTEATASPETLRQFAEMCKKCDFDEKYTKHLEPKELSYTDKQSVHIFMVEIRECIDWLIKTHKPHAFERPFKHSFFDYAERSTYPIYQGKTLHDILALVMDYINKSEHRRELLKIMRKQLFTPSRICVSGHISALVSCLHGFPGLPEVKSSAFEHEKAAIFHYLNRNLNLLNVNDIRTSIQTLFRNNQLTITEFTTRILTDYTHEPWTLADLGEEDNVTPE
jgi:hypothetical protein